MTAHATMEERQRCLAAGMNDHIAKPIDPVGLLETVALLPAVSRYRHVAKSLDMQGRVVARRRQSGALSEASSTVRRTAGVRGPQIQEALDKKDVALAERLAHTLKGVAGNIGATHVQSAAGALEKAIRDGATASTRSQRSSRSATTLAPVIAEIGGALHANAPAPPKLPETNEVVDPARSREAAIALTALLSDMDPAAIDYLETNHAALRPLFAVAEWPAFEDLVRGYAFADAQSRLEQALT